MTRRYSSIAALFFALFQFAFTFSATSQPLEIKESGLQLTFTSTNFSSSFYAFECGYGVSNWKDLLEEDLCAPLVWIGSSNSLGCIPPTESLEGKIAVIRQGAPCSVATKVSLAQEAGALAVLILEKEPGVWYAQRSKTALSLNNELPAIRIPAFYLRKPDFQNVQNLLESGADVTVCLKRPAIFLNSVGYPTEIQQHCFVPVLPFRFSARLSNSSGVNLENVTVTGVLQRFDETEVVTSTLSIPEIDASVQDSLYLFPDVFTDILTVPEWHFIIYTVQGTLNGQPFTDIRKIWFDSYSPWYAKSIIAGAAYQPDTIPEQGWGVANPYYISGYDEFYLPTVRFTLLSGAENPNEPFEVEFAFFKINEDILPDFSNFSTAAFSSASMNLLAVATVTVTPQSGTVYGNTYLTDVNEGAPIMVLEPNRYYLLAAFFPDRPEDVYFGFDDSQVTSSRTDTWIFTDKWHLNGLYGQPNAAMYMALETFDLSHCDTDTEEPSAIDFKIYPNPSRDYLVLQPDLQETVEAYIEITDMTGRVVLSDHRQLFGSEKVTFPVAQLPDGAYAVRITTREGSLTKKFIVQKN